MKIFVLQTLLFIACQSAYHSIGSTPTYVAVVQEKMPGNIMADDEPNAHQRHFTRTLYILLPDSKTLQIDSIVYERETIGFEIEKLADKKSRQVGNSMVTNQPVTLAASTGKHWWKIRLQEGNLVFDQSDKLNNPLVIYAVDAGQSTTWQIDRETIVAPDERY